MYCETCYDGCWYCKHNSRPGFERAFCVKGVWRVAFLGMSILDDVDSLRVKHFTCEKFKRIISKKERDKRIKEGKYDWVPFAIMLWGVVIFFVAYVYFIAR